MIGSTVTSTSTPPSREASPRRAATPQSLTFQDIADIFANADTPDKCAAAANAFINGPNYDAEGALSKLCGKVPAERDSLATICGRIADGLGTANVRKAGLWQELLLAVKSAPDTAHKQSALNACARHLGQLKMHDPVLWGTLLGALPQGVAAETLVEVARAMTDAGVEAPALWSSLMECAGAPADLAVSLSKAGVTGTPAWVALHERIDKSDATPDAKSAASRAMVDAFLRSPEIDTPMLESLMRVVGWSVVADSLGSTTPAKALSVVAAAAPPADQKKVLGFLMRLAEKQPAALPVLVATLIDLRIDDRDLWARSLSMTADLKLADISTARAVCVLAIPFLRSSGLVADRQCMAPFTRLRSFVDYAYSWDQMMEQVRKKHPSTQSGWPSCVPTYREAFVGMARTPAPRTDDAYKAQIIQNGKLLVGDFHNVPEGVVMLCHMMNALPVGGLFLEERCLIVLENAQFMAWFKANPDATPAQTLDKAIELCWAKETPASPMFRELKNFGFALLTLPETADTWIRWMEAECAVARTVITRNIPVKQLFNSPEMVDSTDPRLLDPTVWKEFTHPQEGRVNVFFGGELHIKDTNYINAETHDLLAKSGGVFAQSVFSRLADQMDARYMKQSFFFQHKPEAWGTWQTQVSVPGASSSGPIAVPQGEDCVHDVVFRLIPKQPWQK